MSVVRDVELPVGVVTFVFTDMEGSTKLLRELGATFGQVLAEHRRLLGGVWAAHGGLEFNTQGDACFVAFSDPAAAVAAAAAAQPTLDGHEWPQGRTVRVRAAVHTGSPKLRDGGYWGIDMHYVARLLNAASGGQVLLSETTASLVDVQAQDLGEHALKDFPAPRRLFHLVVDGRGHDQFPAPRTLRAGRTNLPAMLSSFIGREGEIDEVCHLLNEARLLTLVGSGGVGKTRMALEVAARMLDGSGDGVWLMDLSPLGDPELVPRDVARMLGVAEEPGRALLESLIESVGQARLLLVLDNCEHLVGAVAELVSALVSRCPGVVVLATSREPLGVIGERLWRVASLSVPGAGATVEDLVSHEAVRLFAARARDHRPEFVLDERNADAVAAVVRRLDGIPLAIELAAARLRSLSIEDLRTRLERSFALLTGGSRGSLARQQTVAAMIDWSYQLLSAEERTVFARLSVFAGGFDLEAAEAVCATDGFDDLAVIDLLGTLVDKSLVGLDDLGERVRYRLLETMRAYAGDKLAAEGETARSAIRQAHRDHYLRLAETAAPQLRGSDQLAWLDALNIDHDNLRAALSFCLEDPDPEPGLRLATALMRFWTYRGHAHEGAGAITVALQRPEASAPTPVRARALVVAGYLLVAYTGELATAEGYGNEALAIGGELHDDGVTADALSVLARIRVSRGQAAAADELAAEAVAIARRTDDAHLLASLLRLQATTVIERSGDARALLSEAMQLYRAIGDRIGVARMTDELGLAELVAGDISTARRHLEEAVRLAREVGLKDGMLSSFLNLGLALWFDGEIEPARALFLDALSLARDAQKTAIPYAVLGVALTMTATEPERAARLHGNVDRLLAEHGTDLEALESRLRQEDRERLRAQLGDARFDEELASGRMLPVEQLIPESGQT